MANWCNNNIKIIGNEKELKKFCKKIKENFLNSFIPTPKELIGTQSPPIKKNQKLLIKYGADNWYDWNIKNWGTKWDFKLDYLDTQNENERTLSFDSAWEPPIEGFQRISKIYPQLIFFLDYEELGVGFKGIAKIKNGLIDNKCFDY